MKALNPGAGEEITGKRPGTLDVMNLLFTLSMGANFFALLENLLFRIRSDWKIYVATAMVIFGVSYFVLYWGMCKGKRFAGVLTAWLFGTSVVINVFGLLVGSPRSLAVAWLSVGGLVFGLAGLLLLRRNWSWYCRDATGA